MTPHGVAIELTEERKRNWSRLAAEIVELCKSRTEGPVEAMAVLQLAMKALEETYGAEMAGIIMLRDKPGKA